MSWKHREIEDRLKAEGRQGEGAPQPPRDLLPRLLEDVPEELPAPAPEAAGRWAPLHRRPSVRRGLQAAAVLVVAVGAGLLARQVEWRTPDPQAAETPVAEEGVVTPQAKGSEKKASEEGGTPEDLLPGHTAESRPGTIAAGEERARGDEDREKIRVGRENETAGRRQSRAGTAPPPPPAVETAPLEVVETDALESEPRSPEVRVLPVYESGEVGEPIAPERLRLFPMRPEDEPAPAPPPPGETSTTPPRSEPSGPRHSVARETVEGSLQQVRDQPLAAAKKKGAPAAAPVAPPPPPKVAEPPSEPPAVFEEIVVAAEAEEVVVESHTRARDTKGEGYFSPEDLGVRPDPDPAADDLMVETAADPLSTFGLDVDTGSWSLARRHLAEGRLPPVRQVRVEGMLNAFDYGDPSPDVGDGDFRITVQGAPSPFRPGRWLMRLGIRARQVTEDRPLALTFVVDTSGSMESPDRLALVQRSLGDLMDRLGPEDTAALVTYGDQARVVVPQPGDPATVAGELVRLSAGGSTNAEAGLRLAYEQARRALRPGVQNRVILLSDGVANVGATTPEELLERVGEEARRGIELTTLGVGMGDAASREYNDRLMEQLADRGDGRYAYLDSLREARRVLGEELAGIETVARDARAQVEFHPATVKRWRLLGYENRAIEDHRFRYDDEDAGEIGSGHAVTVLYELEPAPAVQPGEPLAVVRLRWWSTAEGRFAEIRRPVRKGHLTDSWERAPRALRTAGVVAHFAEMLRGTRFTDRQEGADPAVTPTVQPASRTRILEDLALRARGLRAVASAEPSAVAPAAGRGGTGEARGSSPSLRPTGDRPTGDAPDPERLEELRWMLEEAVRLAAKSERQAAGSEP